MKIPFSQLSEAVQRAFISEMFNNIAQFSKMEFEKINYFGNDIEARFTYKPGTQYTELPYLRIKAVFFDTNTIILRLNRDFVNMFIDHYTNLFQSINLQPNDNKQPTE